MNRQRAKNHRERQEDKASFELSALNLDFTEWEPQPQTSPVKLHERTKLKVPSSTLAFAWSAVLGGLAVSFLYGN
jgi:hypothetical protein